MDASAAADGAAAMDTTAAASTAAATDVSADASASAAAGTDAAAAAASAEAGAEGHINGTPLPKLVDGWPQFPTVRERYFTTYTTGNHQCVHHHSNGLLVLGVSPDHPSLQPPNRVTAVKFRSHDGKNLLNTAVSGKKKAGAVFLSERDMVCTIDISDGTEVTMYACVRGNVIEINERLLAHPELVSDSPHSDGYLCVMLPKLQEKRDIGKACSEFDHTVLMKPSGNEKRRQEGKAVRSKGAKRARGGADGLPAPCWNYVNRGECRYGDACKFGHGEQPPAAADAPVAPPAALVPLEHGDGAGQATEAAAAAAAEQTLKTESEAAQADQPSAGVSASTKAMPDEQTVHSV